MKNQKLFIRGSISIIVGIVVVAVVIVLGIALWQSGLLEKKITPTPTPTPSATPTVSPVPSPSPTPDQTAGWEVFSDERFGIIFKYPKNWNTFAPLLNYSKPNLVIDILDDISNLPIKCEGIGECQESINLLREKIGRGTVEGIVDFNGGKGVLEKFTAFQGEGPTSPSYKLTIIKDVRLGYLRLYDYNSAKFCKPSNVLTAQYACDEYLGKIQLGQKVNDKKYKTYNDFIDLIKNTLIVR